MARLFGTDGVRGVANQDLTADLAFRVGWAAARILAGDLGRRPQILIGTDTRISCAMLEAAIVAGICAAGADALQAGVITTPGIAYLCRYYNCAAGIMISASHNSYEFNGIKIFQNNGYKLPDELEDRIESLINSYDFIKQDRPTGPGVGRSQQLLDAAACYSNFLQSQAVDLTGLKLGLDCANGASYKIAPALFAKLGAEVLAMAVEPDGLNINAACGSLYPEKLSQLVRDNNCDIGLAFDGDADRLIAVDENGLVADGDVIMAVIARHMKENNSLKKDALVATVMSNLGLELMARANGIHLVRSKVGDRYVLEQMLLYGYALGGEQSGHIISLDQSTTGDGLLTALNLLKALKAAKQSLGQARQIMKQMPQVLRQINISEDSKQRIIQDEDILHQISKIEETLGESGRILVRPSGTEPLLRVMIEGEDPDFISSLADQLISRISQRLSLL